MTDEQVREQISIGAWTCVQVVFSWLIRKQIEKQVGKRVRHRVGPTGMLEAQALIRCAQEQAKETYR
jgi:hypothetical protein